MCCTMSGGVFAAVATTTTQRDAPCVDAAVAGVLKGVDPDGGVWTVMNSVDWETWSKKCGRCPTVDNVMRMLKGGGLLKQ